MTKSDKLIGAEGEDGEEGSLKSMESLKDLGFCRKEKRKLLKKLKRKQIRKDIALKEREEEESRLNDEEEQRKIELKEKEETEMMERQRREFEERERLWMERAAEKAQEEEAQRQKKLLEEESRRNQDENEGEFKEDDEWEYVEEGPAEIIWQGNEIIVKKKKVKVAKKSMDQPATIEDASRPTSNPLPPQSEVYASYRNTSVSSQQVFESVSQQNPNFGTEQDKAHCPFHIKTGACRFGARCSRAHFYPDKSCTLLIKNMYNGPGLAWEQDEGLECTEEEIERSYEEFYEDVHTEFLKYGEIVNFKVCKNGSSHLRGNVYVHYKSLESAILAYDSINGRYFAAKQITCEYVGVTRWRVAICGEYMKSRLKTCSRGTACNFIHCFHNPGGDYEWADWDNPPPRYWIRKMAALFGPSDERSRSRDPSTSPGEEADHRSKRRKTTRSSSVRREEEECYYKEEKKTRSSRDRYDRHSYRRHSKARNDDCDSVKNVKKESRWSSADIHDDRRYRSRSRRSDGASSSCEEEYNNRRGYKKNIILPKEDSSSSSSHSREKDEHRRSHRRKRVHQSKSSSSKKREHQSGRSKRRRKSVVVKTP